MDSVGFYTFYLILLMILCALTTIYFIDIRISNKYHDKILKLKTLLKILFISVLTIYLLDSMPYLFIDIREFSVGNIILSNIFLLLTCFSSVMYVLSIDQKASEVRKDLD